MPEAPNHRMASVPSGRGWRLSRREVLLASLAGACLPMATGCERVISSISRKMGTSIPKATAMPSRETQVDPAFHLLSRAGFGPWPGDLALVRNKGATQWIDEQLDHLQIDDSACELRARRFESIHLSPGLCYEFKKPVLREEITRHALLKAVYSRRQLFESMVQFWSDHLNINLEKGDCVYLKPTDDREVIRAFALGRFRDLIRASATSGAMLVYLDGKDNKKTRPSDVPNENYARELLELHTLGVDGGYTQRDVAEVARCLTGWTLRGRWRRGEVAFDPTRHDDGAKRVLGHDIAAGGGEKDLDAVVDIVASHPSTARHIAFKLCRWFVADVPPASLVQETASVFTATQGDIKAVVRSILTSPQFQSAEYRAAKIKPPLRFVASALRAMAADTHAHAPLTGYLERMGEALFQYPTPEGYSPEPAHVLGTLLWRWNFAFALATGSIPTVSAPKGELWASILASEPDAARFPAASLARHLFGRMATEEELKAVAGFKTADSTEEQGNDQAGPPAPPDTLFALLLASPAFQRY